MIRYEIDDNGFLTGGWAIVGGFPNQIEMEQPLDVVDLNLRWDGKKLVKDTNPKVIEKKLKEVRTLREKECFAVINRGTLWFDSLTADQIAELKVWYKLWLDVTETTDTEGNFIIPAKPVWLES